VTPTLRANRATEMATESARRADKGLAGASALLAWQRARTCGSQDARAQAVLLLGAALLQVNANRMTLACYETAMKLGVRAPANLSKAQLATSYAPKVDELKGIQSEGEKGRKELVRGIVGEEFQKLVSSRWIEGALAAIPRGKL
jgi:hypothetical protein